MLTYAQHKARRAHVHGQLDIVMHRLMQGAITPERAAEHIQLLADNVATIDSEHGWTPHWVYPTEATEWKGL